MKRWQRRALVTLGAVTALGVVVHLPPVARMFGHGGSGGCPFGYGSAPRVAVHHDGPRATSRPALGFELGSTREADVVRWAHDADVTCTSRQGGTMLECLGVPATALPAREPGPALAAAWFRFDADGVLASLQTTRREPTATPIVDELAATQSKLTASLGEPAARTGESTVAALSAGALRQASVEYRFADYHAVVRATNMRDGYLLTESYEAM